MKFDQITLPTFILSQAILLGGCVHEPWHKAEYVPEQVGFESGRHCDPAVREQLDHLYVNGHFIHVRLFGSDRTSLTEMPPYRLVVDATSNTLGEGYIRIHGITVRETNGKQYMIENLHPGPFFNTDTAAVPVTIPLDEDTIINFCMERKNRGQLPVSKASAMTDNILDFSPEDGEAISIDVDIEVQQAGKSERLTIRYLLQPLVTQGRFQWFT